MEAADANGGNAEVARDEPNLQTGDEMPESQDEMVENTCENVKMEESGELNGDVKSPKKKGTPLFRRKLRKFKANSTGNADNDTKPQTRGQKRKLSEPDDVSSEDSTEFNGFDAQVGDSSEPGSQVLQKLIAEAESAESPLIKRRRRSASKGSTNTKNLDEKNDDGEFAEGKFYGVEGFDGSKLKRDKESDTDSIGASNSLDLDTDPLKLDDNYAKSANSSANSSPSGALPKLKVSRVSRGISPGGALKQKVAVDMTNPLFREPFKYGWKRELVFRAGSENAVKRMADIYYYTPKGKKVRSFREVAEYLNTKELSIDNFTFFKEPLGVNNPDFEIIRDARVRDSTGPIPTPPKKVVPAKKTPVAKKIVEKPLTPPPAAKVVGKSPKVTPSSFKVKVPAKKAQQKKEVAKSPPKEPEMLPPQWNSPPTTRRNQPIVEKTPPAKPKRVLKAKLQEPCSIRCSTSMGLIPSLQCHVCLCLYHPECVGDVDVSVDNYVCKNCNEDTSKSQQHQQVGSVPPPPPLIPISMISAQNAKPIPATTVNSPPKLQRIGKKSETTENTTTRTTMKNSSKNSNSSRSSPATDRTIDGSWLQSGNEFLHSHDGTIPKPAQNIALMAGKRYIVVPKNNAMAVQPAVVTGKTEKIGDKAPAVSNNSSHTEMPADDSSLTPTERTNDNDKTNDEKMAKETTFSEIVTPIDATNELDESMDDRQIPEAQESNEITEKVPNDDSDTETPKITTNDDGNEKSADNEIIEDINSENNSVVGGTKFVKEKLEKMNVDSNDEKIETTDGIISESIEMENFAAKSDSVSSDNVATSFVSLSSVNKKKTVPADTDQRHFMVSVCAGYHALSRIFQYLKVQELLRAARVCKMWRDLAAHPNLWKTVRMKNSQVTDWDGLADSLKRHGTQHLDLRKMLVAGESDGIWKKFVTVIPRVTSLVKLELCRCPVMVVEEVIKSCPQLEILSAMSIKCDSLNLESVGNLRSCQELRLKAISGMSLHGDLSPLQELTQLTHLSLTSVKELGKKRIDVLASLINLETLELGECSDFPDKFGTSVLLKLEKLERLRLEKGQGTCCTFDILDGVSKLETLNQMELVNFDVKNGFDKCLSNCKNIKRLLIIPTYISQSATSNNMVLGGVTELSNNLTHFVWGVTLELLRVTELFVDQCNQMNKQVTGDSIPVLKPVPCLKLIEDVQEDHDPLKIDDKPQPNLTNPQVDILPLPQLQKLLLTALPKTRVKILKIPFHATWRQSISDTTTQ